MKQETGSPFSFIPANYRSDSWEIQLILIVRTNTDSHVDGAFVPTASLLNIEQGLSWSSVRFLIVVERVSKNTTNANFLFSGEIERLHTDRNCSCEGIFTPLLLSMVVRSLSLDLPVDRGSTIEESSVTARLPQLPRVGRSEREKTKRRRLTSVARMSEMCTEFTEVDGFHSLTGWQEETGRDDDQDQCATSRSEIQGR